MKSNEPPYPNNLYDYRQKAHLSQDKLATAVDCSRRQIGTLEAGSHDPSLQMAYRLAKYFDVALPVLFPYLDDEPTTES